MPKSSSLDSYSIIWEIDNYSLFNKSSINWVYSVTSVCLEFTVLKVEISWNLSSWNNSSAVSPVLFLIANMCFFDENPGVAYFMKYFMSLFSRSSYTTDPESVVKFKGIKGLLTQKILSGLMSPWNMY